MKHILYIFFGLLILISCTSDKEKLQENAWIGKYFHDIDEGYLFETGFNQIYTFNDDDSIRINYFIPERGLIYKKRVNKLMYEISDSLYFIEKEDKFGRTYEIYNDSLILYAKFNNPRITKVVFEKLPSYNQAKQKLNFQEFLINSNFELFDSASVDFRKDGSLWTSDLRNFRTVEKWRLATFKEELFLIVDDYSWADIIHIKEIDKDGFIGIDYGYENLILDFKVVNKWLFNSNKLVGKWKSNYGFSKAVGQSQIDINFFINETLVITDSTINDEFWKINKRHDLITFPNKKNSFRNTQWHIKELTNETLIIDRYCIERNDSCNYRETITFERIE